MFPSCPDSEVNQFPLLPLLWCWICAGWAEDGGPWGLMWTPPEYLRAEARIVFAGHRGQNE